MKVANYHIALIGNPNSGKSSLFNNLTGMRQKVGNYPGITVDKKQGLLRKHNGIKTTLTDLPGTYSLYPNSKEELIVSKVLVDKRLEEYPNALIYVCDVTSIHSQLLLFTQILDLKLPTLLVLNMGDEARKRGITVDKKLLEKAFDVPCVVVSSRSKEGYQELYDEIEKLSIQKPENRKGFYEIREEIAEITKLIRDETGVENPYQALLIANHIKDYDLFDQKISTELIRKLEERGFKPLEHQIEETLSRFNKFEPLVDKAVKGEETETNQITDKLDRILTHRILGPVIFVVITLFIFQSIYTWSEHPMSWIENGFAAISGYIHTQYPSGWLSKLITEGILAGISGVLIFIPQIAVLFFLITLLEESGYMARAVFLCDRLMQACGLNGRSVIALIAGGACAIPAIMSTRTITNFKERLITIMVTPLISCSARIPVYVILVGLVIPSTTVFGIFNLQGVVFTGLYMLGIVAALGAAFAFHKILKTKETSYLTLELPNYRTPQVKNVFLTVYEKVKVFVIEAGKIIFFVSIILWFLSSFGLPGAMNSAEDQAVGESMTTNLDEEEVSALIDSRRLEASFAGNIGKFMEPAIEPLGYDWKIGIALLTSFAAREVFVGTMATIYSVGNDDTIALREKMRAEVNRKSGNKVFTLPTGLSLMLFYAFAMQCMSTLAVVKRETNSWKWPIIQFVFMGILAYLAAFVAFQVSSGWVG